jgi:dihydrofolate reductase
MADFKITLHLVMSLDGFMAKKDKSIDWFESSCDFENGVDFPNTETFLNSIDCYVMGSSTYEFALQLAEEHGWPYGNKPTFVLSTRELKSERESVEFFSGHLEKLVDEKLRPRFKNIWIVGGSKLATDFLNAGLVNEINLGILPILLGEGIPVFNSHLQEHKLQLKSSTAYKNGLVEMVYSMGQF